MVLVLHLERLHQQDHANLFICPCATTKRIWLMQVIDPSLNLKADMFFFFLSLRLHLILDHRVVVCVCVCARARMCVCYNSYKAVFTSTGNYPHTASWGSSDLLQWVMKWHVYLFFICTTLFFLAAAVHNHKLFTQGFMQTFSMGMRMLVYVCVCLCFCILPLWRKGLILPLWHLPHFH